MNPSRPGKRTILPGAVNGHGNGNGHAYVDEPHGAGSAGEAGPEEAGRPGDADENARALYRVVEALVDVTDVDDAVITAMETVRGAFGWAYGSYWTLDPRGSTLRFAAESGSVNKDFKKVTESARFREGRG